MERNKTGKVAIPLKDIWFVLWNRKGRILLFALFFFLLGAAFAAISNLQSRAHPRYITSAAIAVISENQKGTFTGNADNPSYNDVYLAQNMADSVIYVATSDKVVDKVIDLLHLEQTKPSELKDALSLQQYENSQIIRIALNWYDPEEGVRILTALTSVLPDILIESLKIGNVEVVDFPRAAVQESGMHVVLVSGLSAFAGLLAGILFYLLRLIFRPTFLSGEDLEDVLEVPVMGEITADKNLRGLNAGELMENGEQSLSGQFVEQTAFCAHILKNTLDSRDEKVVFVTSALAGEGKTTFAAVLAWQLALQQKKVLLVDLDTRKPSLSRYFLKVLDKGKTVNAVARGELQAAEACVSVSEYLDLLPGYLGKTRVRMDDALIRQLLERINHYQYVIFDSSPVGLVSDVMHLKKLSGQAVLVVEQGKAWQGLVADCANRLEKADISILGGVLNKVNIRTPANRYYYRNYGSDAYYYYGNRKKKTRGKTGKTLAEETSEAK